MRIQHNLSAMNSLSQYHGNNSVLSGNLEKLSSGYKINSAADDAAGLAISEKMRAQISGLEKAQDNANDGISLIQTAEGALKEVNSMLTRLTTLATQSANGTYDKGVDRANLQEETDALLSEIDRISQSTNFNGINLLDGSMSTGGIKQTEAAVNINGIAMTATKSLEGEATSYVLDLENATGVAAGDKQTFKFSYRDESGEDKSTSIAFETGLDKVATTKNLAQAINNDSELGSHFNAHVNDDNELVIESNVKAFAADGANITRGAASISNVDAVSSGVTIEDQKAGLAVTKLADHLYDKDGFEVAKDGNNATAEITAALEKGDLYTEAPNVSEYASIASNPVKNAADNVNLTAEGRNLTADTTFTLSKKSEVDKSNTTANATNIQLTEAGESLNSATTFTFHGAALGTIAADLNTSSNLALTSKTEALTEDTRFVYHSATADNTAGKVGDYTKNRREDTTFTFKDASISTTGTSANLGNVTLADGAETLTGGKGIGNSTITSTATSVTFTYTAAGINNDDTSLSDNTITSASLDSAATSLTKSLTEKTTLTYTEVDGIGEWTISGGGTVNLADYFDEDSATFTSLQSINSGGKIVINAGHWDVSDGAEATNASVSDISQYLKFDNGFRADTTGQTVKVDLGGWNMSTEANAAGVDLTAASFANYFTGVSPDSGDREINVKAGYWQSTNTDFGDNGVIKDEDISKYFTGGDFSTASLTGGETINVTAGYWTANNSKIGDGANHNVGDGSTYFTGITATSGQKIALKLKADWSAESDDPNVNGAVSDIKQYMVGFNSNVASLNEGDVTVSAAKFTMNKDAVAQEGDYNDYVMTNGRTSSKTYDLSSLNDGDRVQINGQNYTYRADESAVKSSSDFHTGAQLAAMSEAITMNDESGNGLSSITVKDQFAEGEALTLQVGDTNKDYQKVSVDIKDMSSTGLGLKGLDISTQESAAAALDTIKTAVNAVSTQRGKLGALQNRLDHTLNNLDATTQNITAAESQIRDTDMAKEMTQYSKNNILAQAAQSMLAQANSMPQGVLSLLG